MIAISGHAAVGKTSIAEALVRRFAGSVRLETECCIVPLAERQGRNISGCSIDAHELITLKSYIEDLLKGRTVSFREYDWKSRSRSGLVVSKTLAETGSLILDGTVSSHPEIAQYCHVVVFFKPANYEEWLPFAVRRDARERWRERSLAVRENEAKYLDAAAIERTFERTISDTVFVKFGVTQNGEQNLLFCVENQA